MTNTATTALQLRKGDTLSDGFHVLSEVRLDTIGGALILHVNGHYGNGVVTTRRFRSNVPVFVVPSC